MKLESDGMTILTRKIDEYLINWKNTDKKKALIIKGAPKTGKTTSVEKFGKENYKSFIEINFNLNNKYQNIFANGYTTENIIKNISLINKDFKFIPKDTLIFFDEIEKCPEAICSLKSFSEDDNYDVIYAGFLIGDTYKKVLSTAPSCREVYTMRSLDFEEYLWANGYEKNKIEDIFKHMKKLKPLSSEEYDTLNNYFHEYILTGGMPEIVSLYIPNKNLTGILEKEQDYLKKYEDIIKENTEDAFQTKLLEVYSRVSFFLNSDSKKYLITKLREGARNREYISIVSALFQAGYVNVCYQTDSLVLPLKEHYVPGSYRIFYPDTGFLTGSLPEKYLKDLKNRENYWTYNGALIENAVGEMLVKSGFNLYFYKDIFTKVDMNYMIRDKNSIVPVEVIKDDDISYSLNKMVTEDQYKFIKYGIKLSSQNNISFENNIYTFPYFLAFLLKRFVKERK